MSSGDDHSLDSEIGSPWSEWEREEERVDEIRR